MRTAIVHIDQETINLYTAEMRSHEDEIYDYWLEMKKLNPYLMQVIGIFSEMGKMPADSLVLCVILICQLFEKQAGIGRADGYMWKLPVIQKEIVDNKFRELTNNKSFLRKTIFRIYSENRPLMEVIKRCAADSENFSAAWQCGLMVYELITSQLKANNAPVS